MARPFVLIGTVIFFTVYILTVCAVDFLPFILISAAAITVLIMLIGIRIRFLRPIFVIFTAITVAAAAYSFNIFHNYLPAIRLATNNNVIISGDVIDTYEKYGKRYITLDNIQLNNNDKTHHRILIKGDRLPSAEIDDFIVLSADGISASAVQKAFVFPDADNIHLSADAVSVLRHISAENHSLRYYFSDLRSFIAKTVSNNTPPEIAGAVNAMITGDKSLLTSETQLIFSYSGISHLFAVSGLHLSLWTSMIFLITERFKGRTKLFGNIFALLFIVSFMAMTGFTPSVVRAGIMMGIFILGKFIRHKSDPLNSLFIALSVILTLSPFSASSISLQMSFLATLGIISFAGPVSESFIKLRNIIKPKLLFNICNTIYTTSALSFIATIFTCPVCAINFGYYSFMAPVTNLLCLPVSQLILPLSSLGIATSFSPSVSAIPFRLCDLIMQYVLTVAEKLSKFPFCTVNTRADPLQIFLICLLIAAIFFVCIFHEKAKPLRFTALALILCFTIASACVFAAEKQSVSIFVPSVGNGSSVICNIGGNKIIIGCGGDKYKEHIFSNEINLVSAASYDLLLVPRTVSTESLYFSSLLKNREFGCIIAKDSRFDDNTEEIIPDSAIRASFANINIDENTKLVYIDNDVFHGARLETDNFTCTFIFNPVSDFSSVPEGWQKGNLLVTRQNIPHAELEFENIIISTDSVRRYEDDTIYTTTHFSDIMYTHTTFSGAKIYANKR